MSHDQYDTGNREAFHWNTSISWKSVNQIVCRGYDTNELSEQADFVDMVFLLLRGELPSQNEHKMLNYLMVSFAEHALSPSAVSARMVASGRPPLNAAIAAGILTFGEAHGPGHIYSEQMAACLQHARESGCTLREAAEELVRRHLEAGLNVPGLHQPQHVNGDPRAAAIVEKARSLGVAGDHMQLQGEITAAYERQRGRKLFPNVLGSAGCALLDLGFRPSSCWAVGILSRAFSCAAHAIEEIEKESPWRASSRNAMVDILDLSLQGPRYYHGPDDRPVPSKQERGFDEDR